MAGGLRTAHVGLGPIGRLVFRHAVDRGLEPVAAVDADERIQGADAGELSGLPPTGLAVGPPGSPLPPADVVFVCTTSRLDGVRDTVADLVSAGLHVVSTCEELAYPWRHRPDLAGELDASARSEGVVVVGTGVNPGFVMDTLVLDVARVCTRVDAVRAVRRVDVGSRRSRLQGKVGVGLTREEFEARVGELGHVGLPESVAMVADALGFDAWEAVFTMEPVVAQEDVEAGEVRVPAGRCLGMRQVASAAAGDGRVLVRHELDMALALPAPEDRIVIEGEPGLEVVVPGGVPGDLATAALAVAAARAVVTAPPGLRTMPELAIRPPAGLAGSAAGERTR